MITEADAMQSGDFVRFVYLTSQQYSDLETKDPGTLYFIQSEHENRVAIGDTMFANYVPAHCTSLTLSTYSLSMGVGESFTLVAYTEPANPSDALSFTVSGANITVTPTSSSNKVTVTGSSVGTSYVVVTCGEFTQTCEVEVHRAWIYTEHILVQNYSPDGAKFKYTAPISLENGQYIEVSIDVSGVTGTKENIISIGQNIDSWSAAGPRMMNYLTASSMNKLSVDLLLGNKARRPVYTLNSTTYTIRIDSGGVRYNGEYFLFDTELRATPSLTYEEGVSALLALNSYDIGSQEGSNRSHATYNYIKYYTTE